MSIPTLLTWGRIALIPVFILCFYLPVTWAHIATTTVFIIAGITDWLDGYLARKLNQTSRFGAFLDPVADKLMVAFALVLLVEQNPAIWFALPAAIIIGREITVSSLREWMAEIGQRANVAVSMVGKIKTTVQLVSIPCLLYREPLLGLPIFEIGLVAFYLSAILTLWSMVVYLRAAWPVMNHNQ